MDEQRPQFCTLGDLATRLGLPVDFLRDEALRGTLCYIDLTPNLGEVLPGDRTVVSDNLYWYFDVGIAAQEILHTSRLSRPPGCFGDVPKVAEVKRDDGVPPIKSRALGILRNSEYEETSKNAQAVILRINVAAMLDNSDDMVDLEDAFRRATAAGVLTKRR